MGLGILPAAGGTQTLPWAIGIARAFEMLLANRRLSSEEAYTMGLVYRVVPKNRLLETAEEMAEKIASFHPLAVRNAKQAALRGLDLSLSEGLELERRLAMGLRGHKGGHEG